METIESWSARPDVRGARLADPDMGAENRRIAPFGPCPGVEFVTLEGIVQPFPLHFHDFWTIGQMVGGRRRMTCRGEVHDLGPEDFVLFGSGEVHGCKPLDDAPLMYRSVVVPVGLFAQAFAESHGIGAASLPDGGPACRFKSVVVRDAALSACMDRLYAFARTDSAHDPLEEEEALWALLAQTARYCESEAAEPPAPEAPSAANVARARAYLEERFASCITLDDLACCAGVSRYHLIRVFSEETGLTPHRYLQAVLATCWRRASIRPRSPRGLGSPIRRTWGACTNRSTASPPAATERRRARGCGKDSEMAVQTSEAIEGAPADQRRPAVRGHALALVTVVVWAVTFVSTKVLLVHLAPIEILFFRFVIGFVALALLRPRILHVRGFKEERWFMLAGATGVTVYYLLENIALTFTTASIVGVVVAAAPLFTGVASAVVLKERLRAPFFVGFAVAMAGVCLVSFAGGASGGLVAEGGLGQAGLIGVALALAAAGTWAVYSIVTKKLSTFGYDSILVTRRTFAWGLAFMLPALPLLGFSPDWGSLAAPEMWGNLVFLGLGASALCFVTWNMAVKELGPVKTSLYIYLVPALTVLASAAVLGDPLTPPVVAGVLLTIAGLFLSERGK